MKKIALVFFALLATLILIAGIYIFAHWVPDRSVYDLKQRWAPSPSQFIDVNGMQVHLRDEGPNNELMPIVLIHGTGASLHTWDGWVQELKKDRRVIRFDLHAFGLTGPSPNNIYSIESYVNLITAVLDKLNLDRVILGGNSLGGYASWLTAALHPNRVDKLILVDSAGYHFKPKSVPLGFKIAGLPVLSDLLRYVLPRNIVESSVKNVYGDPKRVTTELIDQYFELTTRAGNRQALAERTKQTERGKFSELIPKLDIPTLILWGTLDRLIPPEYADRFHQDIPNSRLIKFENLGHVPHEEAPELTVTALVEFLASSDISPQ